MTYIKVNVNRPEKPSPGKGGDKMNKVTLVDLADLLVHAPRDSKGIVINDKHQFKANAYAITLYVTSSSIAAKSSSEGDADEEGFLQEVVFSHPGTEREIREFRYNWLGRDILMFDESCSDGVINEYGSPCAPLRMKIEGTDDKDSKKTVFTLSSVSKGPDIAIYNNTLTLSDVADTIDADATTIDIAAGEGEYQLTDGSTAPVTITTCTNAVDGMIFTLLGSGGTYPSLITSENDFILNNGTSWNALANSTITFKAFKDGASTWKFIEQSRT